MIKCRYLARIRIVETKQIPFQIGLTWQKAIVSWSRSISFVGRTAKLVVKQLENVNSKTYAWKLVVSQILDSRTKLNMSRIVKKELKYNLFRQFEMLEEHCKLPFEPHNKSFEDHCFVSNMFINNLCPDSILDSLFSDTFVFRNGCKRP